MISKFAKFWPYHSREHPCYTVIQKNSLHQDSNQTLLEGNQMNSTEDMHCSSGPYRFPVLSSSDRTAELVISLVNCQLHDFDSNIL